MSYTVVDSPIDPLTLVANDSGALTGVYMVEHRHQPDVSGFGDHLTGPDAEQVFGATMSQLDEYFAGQRIVFDLALEPKGTDFQRAVWTQLSLIPYGQTISYAELALRVGNPKAVRAVGLANGRNPLSIVVPCHRVIGASGSLTGFGGGIERKRYLLDLERGHQTDTPLWDEAVSASRN